MMDLVRISVFNARFGHNLVTTDPGLSENFTKTIIS
jgi:hypothetical protein